MMKQILFLLSLALSVAIVYSDCQKEFDPCEDDSDCCKPAWCHESMCMSHKSLELNDLDQETKISIVKNFYSKNGANKRVGEVENEIREHRDNFAMFIRKLSEKKAHRDYYKKLNLPHEEL